MADLIDQSVPKSGREAQQQAMLEMLTGDDQEEALRKQAMVQQLRDYGGGAMPSMYGKHAPQPLEYAATLGTRLASMGGQTDAREAERRALIEMARRAFGGGGAPAAGGVPADPGFQGVGAVPY